MGEQLSDEEIIDTVIEIVERDGYDVHDEIIQEVALKAGASGWDAKDAERYRWLRFDKQNIPMSWRIPSGDMLDTAIDSCMAEQAAHDKRSTQPATDKDKKS